MSKYRTIRFMAQHQRLARFLNRTPARSVVARLVWAELESDPTFNERMRQAEAELEAGRGVLYRVDEL